MPAKKLMFQSREQREREENVFLRVYLGEATPADIAALPKAMLPTIQFCLTMSSCSVIVVISMNSFGRGGGPQRDALPTHRYPLHRPRSEDSGGGSRSATFTGDNRHTPRNLCAFKTETIKGITWGLRPPFMFHVKPRKTTGSYNAYLSYEP